MTGTIYPFLLGPLGRSLGACRIPETLRFRRKLLECCLRILCRLNVFTESLPSDERLFYLHYSGFRAQCHNTVSRRHLMLYFQCISSRCHSLGLDALYVKYLLYISPFRPSLCMNINVGCTCHPLYGSVFTMNILCAIG
jgi:hypothetical protein